MKKNDTATNQNQPTASRITRRQFVVLAGVAGIAAAVGVVSVREARKSPLTGVEKFQLPDTPNQNPAYRALTMKDGQVILGTQDKDNKFKGFRLNQNGHQVWQLCDGNRSAAQIAAEYQKATGRSASEAEAFLKRLLKMTLVVSGMYIVHGGGFPKATAGGWYYQPPR